MSFKNLQNLGNVRNLKHLATAKLVHAKNTGLIIALCHH